jgi:hypothetical protein
VQTLDHDSVSLHIAAPAERIYSLVADVTRTPEFSPEILRCTWLDGATGPAVGARFAAVNKVPHRPSWTNRPVVLAVEPGRRFAFERTERLGGTVEWSYRFEPDRDGTLVTVGYEVTRPVPWLGWFMITHLFGRPDRRTDLRQGMEQTLQRLGSVAEGSGGATPSSGAAGSASGRVA